MFNLSTALRIILSVAILVLAELFAACTDEQIVTVCLRDLKKFDFRADRLSLILIKSYPNNRSCNGKIKNANLYICKITETNDTILVFEPCLIMPDFAQNNFKGERDLVINKEDVIKEKIDEINIANASNAIFLNGRYKYLIGSFTFIMY